MTGTCCVCGISDPHLVMVGSPWNISFWACSDHAVDLREKLLEAKSPEEVIEIQQEETQ